MSMRCIGSLRGSVLQGTALLAGVKRPAPAARGAFRCVAAIDVNKSIIGDDFGARDATAGELESNFSEKVLGNFDTEHVIRPPEQMGDLIGLKNKRCESCEGGAVALLDEAEVNRLQLQCAGWRVRDNAAGVQCLACDWKVRNFTAGLELFSRIAALAEDEGHHPDLHLTGYSNVTAELTTHSVGGLTTNDFIMAAKINELELADLQPRVKPKYWA